MRRSILIIGGYGEVGKTAAHYLARFYPGNVVVAGRRFEMAEAFAESTHGAVRPMRLDINHLPDAQQYLRGVGTVVSCVERSGDSVVRACLDWDVNYTEAATSFECLDEILRLREYCSTSRASVLAGAGLIPGLSGVLAAHLAGSVRQVRDATTYVMLGSGDLHGVDAVRWLLEYMDRRFTIQTSEGLKEVESITSPKKVRFPTEKRWRSAYRFDFADQHVLLETVHAESASTYLCFDSRLLIRADAPRRANRDGSSSSGKGCRRK